MVLAALLSASSLGTQSVCETDDRVASSAGHVGVVSTPSADPLARFCTITLISEACALTAGHCLHLLDEAEFSDPDGEDGKFAQSPRGNRYKVDKASVRALQSRIGNDWAVVRLLPNTHTGLLPGKTHGFVEVELKPQLTIETALETHSAQREAPGRYRRVAARGDVLAIDGSILFHNLDTSAGSSGSLITEAASGKAVAIHTHGGCDTMKNNKATIISRVPHLVKGIRACLVQEAKP